MTAIISRPNTHNKLQILAQDAQYDLACACGTKDKNQHRKRTSEGWIYPVTLPNGGKSPLFKTLLSNVCSNDCIYCPLREQNDLRRCSLTVEETVKVFLDYYRAKKVFGLFLSSGVIGSTLKTMDKLIAVAHLLRKKHNFKGYIHLKILPGSQKEQIDQAVALSSAVSLNIETPGQRNLQKLSRKKKYIDDIIEPIKYISQITAPQTRYSKVKQTTQFIVGPAEETDRQIVKYTERLYSKLKLSRIYFSAYQPVDKAPTFHHEKFQLSNMQNSLTREHRLYQVDFLFRKYGFTKNDIYFDDNDQLSLNTDPKEIWANANPQFFPLNINSVPEYSLLRVPGLGHVTVNKILNMRKHGKIKNLNQIGYVGKRLAKAKKYLIFE